MSKKEAKTIAQLLIKGLEIVSRDTISFEEKEKEMLAHMYEKYGVELQVDWFAETASRDSYDSWNCSIKGNTDSDQKGKIEVHRWRNREENKYTDTYFPLLIRDEIEKRVDNALKGYIDSYKVYQTSFCRFVDNKYTSVEQIDKYLEERGNKFTDYCIRVMILDQGVKKSNEELIQSVLERLKGANIGNVYVDILCMEKSVFEERTRSNSQEIRKNMNGKIMYHDSFEGRIY